MVGLTSLAVTPGYLICWMLERPKDKSKEVLVEKKDDTRVGIGCRRQVTLKQPFNHKPQILRWLLVGLMAAYYFAFIGVESSLRTFTSTFAVSSSLKLTRAQVKLTRAQVAADSITWFPAGIGHACLLLPHLCCQPCSGHPPLHLGETPSHPRLTGNSLSRLLQARLSLALFFSFSSPQSPSQSGQLTPTSSLASRWPWLGPGWHQSLPVAWYIVHLHLWIS